MAVLTSQPVAVAGGLGAIVAPLVSWALPSAPLGAQGAIVALVVIVIIFVARQHSFPVDTLIAAGLNPEQVAADAKDERVAPFVPPSPSTAPKRPRTSVRRP